MPTILQLASVANEKANAYRDVIDNRPGMVHLARSLSIQLLAAVDTLTTAIADECAEGPTPALLIEDIEDQIHRYFRSSTLASDLVRDDVQTFLIQELGPVIADLLHARGVQIDWKDGSRYGTVVAQ